MKTKATLFASFILAGMVFCLLMASPAWSADYYVDIVNGNDELNNGTASDTAWQTLHHAVGQLTAGDVLNVAAGTYSVSNGELDAVLTITQDNVTIQGTTGVVIDGEATCSSWNPGFNITGSGVVLRNLEITRFACDGTSAARVQSGSNNRIESCAINSSDYGVVFESTSGTGNVVEDCKIHDNLNGVDILGASPQILRNTIYDNSVGINISEYAGQTIRPKIINNLIYATDSAMMEQGVYAVAFSTDSTIAAEIRHNTIFGGQFTGIYIAQEFPNTAQTMNVGFNIIKGFSVGIEETVTTSSILVADYNNVVNNSLYNYNNVTPGTHDLSIDPLFVDAGNFNFHLAPTSPLINLIRADAGDTVTDDLDGVTRPKGLGAEMGCYEISDTSVIWVVNTETGYSRLVLPDINGDGYDELLLHLDPVSDQVFTTLQAISGADGASVLWFYSLPLGRRGMAIINSLDGDAIQDIIVITGTSSNDPGSNAGDDQMIAISGAVSPPANREIWAEPRVIGYGFNAPVVLPDTNGDGYEDVFAYTITPDIPYTGGDHGFHVSGKDGSILWDFDSGIWDIYGRTETPDLDGDGVADVVICGAGGTSGVEAWKGGGSTASKIWSALAGLWIRNPSVIGDLTGDGVPEVAVAKFNETPLGVYVLNGADGSAAWPAPFEFGNTASSIENIGDINGSGFADIVIGSYFVNSIDGSDYNVYALEGDPNASTRIIWSYDVGQNNYARTINDMNGDGIKDVIVTGNHSNLLLLSGVNGSALAQEPFPNGSGTVQTGEFNNTAGNDILTSVGNSIYALSFAPTGSYQNNPPATPVPEIPANEAVISTINAASLTLRASAFSDPDGDAHGKSYWEVERSDSGDLLPSYSEAPNETGLTQHTVLDTLDPGLKYAWRVKYEDENGAASGWSSKSTFKVGTSERESLPQVPSGKTRVDFGMISIVHWPDDPSPEKVFNIQYDPRYYRIGTYDPVLGVYLEMDDGLEIEPGRSYWMLAREGLAVNFNGIPVSRIHDIEVCLHYGVDGWNMIAPPNDANYAWGEVLVGRWVEGSPDLTIVPVALASGSPDIDFMIDPRIWEWKAGVYVSYLPADNFLLERYRGYWVKANVDGVYLVFPEYAQTALPQASSAALSSSARGTVAEDGDGPPMPMGALKDSGNDNIFSGCFVETVTK